MYNNKIKLRTKKALIEEISRIPDIRKDYVEKLSYILPEQTIDFGNNIILYKGTMNGIHTDGVIFAGMCRLIDGRGMIMVDRFFDLLPKNVKKFMLYHEIGHCVNGDGVDMKHGKRELFLRDIGKIPESERKADEYAVSVIGADIAINSLAFLMKCTDLPIITKIEMGKRIRNIQRMMK